MKFSCCIMLPPHLVWSVSRLLFRLFLTQKTELPFNFRVRNWGDGCRQAILCQLYKEVLSVCEIRVGVKLFFVLPALCCIVRSLFYVTGEFHRFLHRGWALWKLWWHTLNQTCFVRVQMEQHRTERDEIVTERNGTYLHALNTGAVRQNGQQTKQYSGFVKSMSRNTNSFLVVNSSIVTCILLCCRLESVHAIPWVD